MRKKIVNLTRRLDDALLAVSAIFLLIATVLAVANAVVRFARLGNITWAEELNTILMILLVFIAQPALEYNDKQLAIGILQNTLKNRCAKQFFTILRGLITVGIIGFLLYYCIKVTGTAIKYNYVTSVLFFPRKYLYTCIIAAFLILILSWLVTIFCRAGRLESQEVDLGVTDASVIDRQIEEYRQRANVKNAEQNGGDEQC